MMQMVERCRTFWHRLQEQGGIHNSHAEILLAREKVKWEEAKAANSTHSRPRRRRGHGAGWAFRRRAGRGRGGGRRRARSA